jgi:uncharacterized protein YegP (UPF0339 family)
MRLFIRLEYYKDKAGQWRWRMIASNGKIIGTSHEGYKNKEDCRTGWMLVKFGFVISIKTVEK